MVKGEVNSRYAKDENADPPFPPPQRVSCSGNSYSLEVVAPASERTVQRNRPVTTAMLVETAEMHASVTAPHIDKIVGDGKALSWLFNVLSKEKEADRVLFENADPVREHTLFGLEGC